MSDYGEVRGRLSGTNLLCKSWSSQSTEFEVIETCAKEIYEMMCSIHQTGDFMYVKGVHVANYNIA